MAAEARPQRERKAVEAFLPDDVPEKADAPTPSGSGDALGEIEYCKAMIDSCRDDDVMTLLHRICYGTPGKKTIKKKMLRAFNGFPAGTSVDAKAETLASGKATTAMLKDVCGILGVEKSGTKEEIAATICGFLISPDESGVVSKSSGGGTKRKAGGGGGGKKSKKSKADGDKPKRPLSAYIVFCGTVREQVKEDNPGIENKAIMSKMGEMWKALSQKEKDSYKST